MKNVKVKLMALMLMVILVFTGCMSEKVFININADGTGKVKEILRIDKAVVNKELKGQGATDEVLDSYWEEYAKAMKEEQKGADVKNVTINGKEYLQIEVIRNLRKGKLTQDLELTDNSYVTTDTFYCEVDLNQIMLGADESGELAQMKDSIGANAVTMDISVTMPKDIVSTNGVFSTSSKNTVSFSVSMDKKVTMFATTKNGVTRASVQKILKSANTIAKPKFKKVQANKVKKNAKKATITVKWAKVKTAKKYEVTIATNKKFTKNVIVKTTKKNNITIKKLKKNKKYFVQVVAIKNNIAGNEVRSKAAKKTMKTKK